MSELTMITVRASDGTERTEPYLAVTRDEFLEIVRGERPEPPPNWGFGAGGAEFSQPEMREIGQWQARRTMAAAEDASDG